MKTSLNIDDRLFKAARREAARQNKTISETISHWARRGYEALKKQKKVSRPVLKSVDLGGSANIDLKSRRDWLDQLDS